MRFVLLTFMVCALPFGAWAQTPDPGAEPGGALRSAIAAYDAGDWPAAQRWFEQAHREAPTARTLRGLGVVAYRQGRSIDAYASLTRSLISNAKPLTEELRASVLTLLNDLAGRLTRVHFQLYPAGAELRIDGAVPGYDASGAVLVSPGEHRATLSAPGYVASEWLLEAQAGLEQLRSWQLALEVTEPPTPGPMARPQVAPGPPPASKRAVATSREERAASLKRWGYGALGAAAVGLVVMAVAVGLGVERVRRIENQCKAEPTGSCTPALAESMSSDERLDLLSGLAIGGGALAGVGAVASTWLLVAARQSDTSSTRGADLTLGVRGIF